MLEEKFQKSQETLTLSQELFESCVLYNATSSNTFWLKVFDKIEYVILNTELPGACRNLRKRIIMLLL